MLLCSHSLWTRKSMLGGKCLDDESPSIPGVTFASQCSRCSFLPCQLRMLVMLLHLFAKRVWCDGEHVEAVGEFWKAAGIGRVDQLHQTRVNWVCITGKFHPISTSTGACIHCRKIYLHSTSGYDYYLLCTWCIQLETSRTHQQALSPSLVYILYCTIVEGSLGPLPLQLHDSSNVEG